MVARALVAVALLAHAAHADPVRLEGSFGLHAGSTGLGGRLAGGVRLGLVALEVNAADFADFHDGETFRAGLGASVDLYRFDVGSSGTADVLAPMLVAGVGAEAIANPRVRRTQLDWTIGLGIADDARSRGGEHAVGMRGRFEAIFWGGHLVGELNTIAISFGR